MQEWMKDWEALSRQFLGALGDIGRGAGAPADPLAAWKSAAQPFAAAFGQVAAPAEVLDRLSASAKGYFALLQSLAGGAGQGKDTAGAWTEALRQGFNFPGMEPSLLDNPLAQALRDLGGRGAQGFDAMMGEFGRVAAPLRQEWQSLLGLPTFGLTREHQERWQALTRAMGDYQTQSNRYQALILKASRDGFERFQGKLAEREEPGRQLESVRQVYDLWIDAAEEAYAEVALSAEFQQAYGAMVNAQMKLRSLVQGEVERMAGQLGLPTRSEVRSLEKAVHELRRAARHGPAAGAEGAAAPGEKSAAQFKAEIAALRAELAGLQGAAKTPPRAKATAKPAAKAPARKTAKTPVRKR
ncbi:MAG TPA: poly(R)-hydroxyalkanoic acid synthase subunit PhaE [Rhodanobacteraceae bacterium]|nr:poly(R)-hydroxyalkanoic acid synthase subunit PhaE [Rhodanobacteraceae bacterium]